MQEWREIWPSLRWASDGLTLLWKQRMDVQLQSNHSRILPFLRWGLLPASGSGSLSALSCQVVLWPSGQLLCSVLVRRLPRQPEQLWDGRSLQGGVCLHVTHHGGVEKWSTLQGSILSTCGQKGRRSWGRGHVSALRLCHCSFTLTYCLRAVMTVRPIGLLHLFCYFLPSASLTTFTHAVPPYSQLWTWSRWDVRMQQKVMDSASATSIPHRGNISGLLSLLTPGLVHVSWKHVKNTSKEPFF